MDCKYEFFLTGAHPAARSPRDRRRELARTRGVVDAAFEGLLICEGNSIVTVNNNFVALIGRSAESLIGMKFEQYFADGDIRLTLFDHPNQSIEATLVHAEGAKIPVELIQRPIIFAGEPHRAIAVRDLRARKEAEKHIRFLAHNDPLTGLPNRASFNKKLDLQIEAALASGKRLAVMFFDLDRFKEINDLFGHAAGDRVLQAVNRRARLSQERALRRVARLSLGKARLVGTPGHLEPALTELINSLARRHRELPPLDPCGRGRHRAPREIRLVVTR